MPVQPSTPPSKVLKVSLWLGWTVAWIPAVLVLYWLNLYVSPLPYHDDWEFVRQYQHWTEGAYQIGDLFRPINGQPLAVPKMLFFAALKWNNGDLGILPYFSWGMSVGVALGVWWLSRGWRRELPGRGWYVQLLWNLGIFSAAQEGTWFWNCTFHTYIPGFCLVMGLVVLASAWPTWLRVGLAGVLATVATLSFGAGFVVPGLLLIPIAWQTWGRDRRCHPVFLGLWLVLTAALIYLALFSFPESGGSGGMTAQVTKQLARPGLSTAYGLVLLGNILADGSPFEPVTWAMGLAGLLVIAAAISAYKLIWREGTLTEALPWVVLCLWAVCNAGLITIVRLNQTLDTALAPRYATHMQFFVAGVTGLLILALWRSAPKWRTAFPAIVAVLTLLQILAWADGAQMMEAQHRRMMQDRAVLSFVKIIDPPLGLIWSPGAPSETVAVARFMWERGLVRGLKFMGSRDPKTFRQGPPLPDKWGSWRLVQESSGERVAMGTCGSSKLLNVLPDLIVLTTTTEAEGERVTYLTKPLLPDDFERRALARRYHSDHYFGWQYKLPPDTPPDVKAYAFYGDSYHLRLIPLNSRNAQPFPADE